MAPKPKEVSVELLEERIRRDGVVKAGGVLKVDAFLNHQMDIELFSQMAEEWKRLFAGKPINKILTIEASGIGIAAVVAHHFGVPVVFAKKTQSINLDGTMYSTRIQSFTHNRIYDVIVSTRFLGPDDHVLITFAFLGVNIWVAITIIGVTTFVLSLVGVVVGNQFGSRFEKPATIAGGIVLILIGLKILIEHLAG